MPVVTTAVKNQPSKRASLAWTARRHCSVCSCIPTACPAAPTMSGGIATSTQGGQPAGQEGPLDVVLRQQQGLLVRRPRLVRPAQPTQEVGPCRREVRVRRQRRLGRQP